MRWATVLLAVVLSACSEANGNPSVTNLTGQPYISIQRGSFGFDGGFATGHTRIGSRSDVRLEFVFTQKVVRIEFVGKENWFDHHSNVQVFWPSPGYKPECQADAIRKLIQCDMAYPGGSGVYVHGTAIEAGTFHYIVKLSEEVEGTNNWLSVPNGQNGTVEWDEVVSA